MKKILIFLILTQISLVNIGQIVADHTVVDKYKDIPQYYIDEVKKIWLVYAGESHAYGLRLGMATLEASEPKYAVNIVESGTPEAYTTSNLRVSTATWGDYDHSSGWVYSYGEEDWWVNSTAITRTEAGIAYCNSHSLTIGAMGFGWCWDAMGAGPTETADPVFGARWWGAAVDGTSGDIAWGLNAGDYAITGNLISLDTYLNVTQGYVDYCTANSIPTKVFFTTGPVDNWGGLLIDENMYQASVKYQYIRDYVTAHPSTILFDYADILSYDNGSVTPNTVTWNGHIYPRITTTNLSPVGEAHISASGELRLAKAMWWMLARLVGWDGGTAYIPVTNITVAGTGGATAISTDGGSLQLLATVLPANSTNKTVTWSLSNGTGQASISAGGLVTAIANGTVTARATANDGSGVYSTLVITISNQVIPVTAITVTAPNGGENWLVGNSQVITWTSSGTSGNVHVEYSINNGTSWTDIIASTPDDGTNSWTIPNTTSTNCLVRVSDTDGSPVDVSNAVFSIVTVTGGTCTNETFTAASGTVTDNSGSLDYFNNMSCEKLIQPSAGGTITLTFTAFNTEANYDYVRVYDGSTTSAAFLGAFSGTSLPPTLTSHGGSMLIKFATDGGVVAAGWSATYTIGSGAIVTGIVVTGAGGVSLITVPGGTLQLSAAVTPVNSTNKTVTWSLSNGTGQASISAGGLVTAIANGTVTARATANDGSGVYSTLVITISNQVIPVAAITVTAPNGGENWLVGNSQVITWTSSGTSGNVHVEYSINNGTSWTDVIASTPDDGTNSWTIPNTTSTNCLVRVSDTDGSPVDVSNAVFSIVTVTGGTCTNETFTAASGTVTDNSGSLDYFNNMSCEKLIQPSAGGTITLTFTAFNTEANYDYVRVYDGSTTSAAFLGAFSGTSLPPTLTSHGGSMLIKFATDGGVVAAGWSATYTIGSGAIVTGIVVTGAGGVSLITVPGGTLQLSAAVTPVNSTNKTVTWSLSNGTGQASISAGGLVTAIANGTVTARATANDGSGVYSTLVITISNQVIPVAAITVTAPNGGENWLVGNSQVITWTSSGTSGNVHVEYSINNGTSWTDVIASTPDDGTNSWTIPNTTSTNCLVRVSDTDGSPVDVSNAVFSIVTVTGGTCTNETFTAASGTVTDNSGSLDYFNNMSCEKLIQPSAGGTITLTFTAFNTEANYDYVRVYDGSTTSAAFLGAFSGTSLPPTLTSHGGSMLIKFATDGGVVAAGWSATYTSDKSAGAKGTEAITEEEIPDETKLIAYPNPTSGVLTIESSFTDEETYNIYLTNSSGQVILNKRINVMGGKTYIDMSNINPGSYLLEIMTNRIDRFFKVIKL